MPAAGEAEEGPSLPTLGLTGGEAEFPFTQLWSQKARDPLKLL